MTSESKTNVCHPEILSLASARAARDDGKSAPTVRNGQSNCAPPLTIRKIDEPGFDVEAGALRIAAALADI
ncbi:MAG: hypothetical protein PVI41_00820 [Roseobacter sp.]